MTYDDLVLKHNEILEYITAEDAAHEEAMKPYREGFKAILTELCTRLQTDKLKNVKTEHGLAHLHTTTSVKVDNRDTFLQFVLKHNRFDMLDVRAVRKVAAEWIEANKTEPPGIKSDRFVTCRIKGKTTNTEDQETT